MTYTSTSTYVSPAEAAAQIRSDLKALHGWTSRQVSVRASSFSMGSAIDVRIKAPGVSVAIVKAIAQGEESIRRCKITGDILNGGNRYVSVSLDWQMVNAEAAKLIDWVKETPVHPSQLREVEVAGTWYLLGQERPNDFKVFRMNHGHVMNSSAAGVAAFFASEMIQAGVVVEVPVAEMES